MFYVMFVGVPEDITDDVTAQLAAAGPIGELKLLNLIHQSSRFDLGYLCVLWNHLVQTLII